VTSNDGDLVRALKHWTLSLTLLMVLQLPGALALAEDPFPYELETGREIALVGSSAALFALGWLLDRDHENLTEADVSALDREAINALDRSATKRWSPAASRASDILMITTAVAPLTLAATDRGALQPLVLGGMYAETMLLNNGAVYLAKNAFTRTRPLAYNDDPAVPLETKLSRTARRSFPSGHTASAFASMVFAASVFSRLYPDSSARGWVWGGCLGVAATTGYLRYAGGWHFPTDILAGAALGSFVGWLVPRIHERELDPERGSAAKSEVLVGVRMGF